MAAGAGLGSKLAALASLAWIVALGGCAAIDGFSSRARDYNTETAETKSGSVLTNILRAAYTEPLQFTDISTVSGQGSINAGVTSGVPFPFRGGQGVPLAQQFITLAPSAGASANSQFSVANLNNQEFYNGLQAPVEAQLIASYMSAGVDPWVLFSLLVSEIEVTRDGRRTIFKNDASDARSYFGFLQAMRFLVDAGISAEKVGDTTFVGPSLSEEEAKNPRTLAALISTTSADGPTLSKTPDGDYRLAKKSSQHRFCFDRARSAQAVPLGRGLQAFTAPTAGGPMTVPLAISDERPVRGLTIRLQAGDYCGAGTDARNVKVLDRTFRIATRSVAGVFDYLGKIVRTELGLQTGEPVSLALKPYPGQELTLFRVRRGLAASSGIAVNYRGETIGIDLDPAGENDKSSRVLQILTELLALKSSAKNLPAPNLVTILGP